MPKLSQVVNIFAKIDFEKESANVQLKIKEAVN